MKNAEDAIDWRRVTSEARLDWGDCHERLWPSLVRALAAANGSYNGVDDAVQEAFARALADRAPADLRSAEAWLFTVALNHLRAERRRARWLHFFEAEAEARSELDEVLARADAQRLLSTLSDRERELVVAKYYVGMTQHELAQLSGLRQGSVASLLARALAKIRRNHESRGGA